MARLILTSEHSGAGHLKSSHVADEVCILSQRLVLGPVPTISSDIIVSEAIWTAHKRLGKDLHLPEARADGDAATYALSDKTGAITLSGITGNFDEIELWFGPLPNDQLVLLQTLAWFASQPEDMKKLSLVHYLDRLGERQAGALATLPALREPVREVDLQVAAQLWRAFMQSTPEAWWRLLEQDLSALPHLRPTVLAMLRELPGASTGLGATEAAIMALIAPGDVRPVDVLSGYQARVDHRVYDYWEVGQTLDWLAAKPEPAILGLDEGPFTLALHDAPLRYARYRQLRLSLTELGHRLVQKVDDISRHKPVRRWWGGTHLTNASLWRWDATAERLIAPQ